MKKLNSYGSHVLALAVGILVVGVIGLAGYKVWQNSKNTSTGSSATQVSSKVPASIKNSADLTSAAKALDESSSQVNTSLDDNSLNSDLNDLL